MDGRAVLQYCPNYYKIMEFEANCFDGITARLINVYREYIFHADLNNNEDVELVKSIDSVLNKYVDDYNFRKTLQEKVYTVKVVKNTANLLKALIKSIIDIFDDYQEYTTRVIYISRWI